VGDPAGFTEVSWPDRGSQRSRERHGPIFLPVITRLGCGAGERPQTNALVIDFQEVGEATNRSVWVRRLAAIRCELLWNRQLHAFNLLGFLNSSQAGPGDLAEAMILRI
jgi:hypothetical protein